MIGNAHYSHAENLQKTLSIRHNIHNRIHKIHKTQNTQDTQIVRIHKMQRIHNFFSQKHYIKQTEYRLCKQKTPNKHAEYKDTGKRQTENAQDVENAKNTQDRESTQ